MRLLFSSLCHTDLQVDEISAYICNLLALNQKNYLRTNIYGKRTVLAKKFAEKESYVFIKKRHFCHVKPTSVNKRTLLSFNFPVYHDIFLLIRKGQSCV